MQITNSKLHWVIGSLVLSPIFIYFSIILSAKYEWWGGSPGKAIFGKVVNNYQSAMQQYCTGALVTPEATWLIGRREEKFSYFNVPDSVPNLAHIIEPDSKAEDPTGIFSRVFGLSSTDYTSFVSRLNADGVFQLVAALPDIACIKATPDGKRLFLFTGLDAPRDSGSSSARQTVIFQSDDQGASWQWREQGLFIDTERHAWNLSSKLYFYDSQSIWSLSGGSVKYSSDGGATIEVVSGSVIGPIPSVPPDITASMYQGGQDSERHILQLNEETVIVWTSQAFHFYPNEKKSGLYSQYITHQAVLKRNNQRWGVSRVTVVEDFFMDAVAQRNNGDIVATISTNEGGYVATFTTASQQWRTLGELPNAFVFLPANNYVDNVYIGEQAIVINLSSRHTIPRFTPLRDKPAKISASSVYYTNDLGKSWDKLAIPGYLGILGLDAEKNRVLWSKPWYKSYGTNIYSYALTEGE